MDISALFALVPAQYAGYVMAAVGVCAVISMAWKPAPGSKLYPVYAVVNAIGMNFNKASNAPPVVADVVAAAPTVIADVKKTV